MEEPKKPMEAVCPYCGAAPLSVQTTLFQIGSHIASLVICANPDCRKVIPIQLVGEMPKAVVEPRSLIHLQQ